MIFEINTKALDKAIEKLVNSSEEYLTADSLAIKEYQQRVRTSARLSQEDKHIRKFVLDTAYALLDTAYALRIVSGMPEIIKMAELELKHAKSNVAVLKARKMEHDNEKKKFSLFKKSNKEKQSSDINQKLVDSENVVEKLETTIQWCRSKIEEQKGVLTAGSNIKQSDISLAKNGTAMNLKSVLMASLSAQQIHCASYNMHIGEYPTQQHDFCYFTANGGPFSIADTHTCYLFADKGIMVFDRNGIYIGTFAADTITYEYLDNNAILIKFVDTFIKFKADTGHLIRQVGKALDAYRDGPKLQDFRLSVIDLLGECTSNKDIYNQIKQRAKLYT